MTQIKQWSIYHQNFATIHMVGQSNPALFRQTKKKENFSSFYYTFFQYILILPKSLYQKHVQVTTNVEKCNKLLLDLGLDCSLISQFTNSITVLKRPVYLYICNIANLTNKFGPLCWWPEFWILFGELLPVPKC